MATPSPMTCVEWWRVCLDEAQMVESACSSVSTMARRFKSLNRWCVTGTPIQRSVRDVYGLFLFLEVDPFRIQMWFEQKLLVPYFTGNPTPLVEALGEILWRTCKRDVVEELGLPEQSHVMHKLYFSPVEEHFYRRIHLASAKTAVDIFQALPGDYLDMRIGELDPDLVGRIMTPLTALRQACCHPSVVRSGGVMYMPSDKACFQMSELLDQLIKVSEFNYIV